MILSKGSSPKACWAVRAELKVKGADFTTELAGISFSGQINSV